MKKFLKLNKRTLLSNKRPRTQTLLTGEFYPKTKVSNQNILCFAPVLLISLFLSLTLAVFSAGCSGGKEDKTAKKADIAAEQDVLGTLPDDSVMNKRAKRESDFKEDVNDPSKNPIIDTSGAEQAPAQYGFGVRTDAQIEKERPRALKIAVLAPLVGDVEVFGKDTVDGAEMAADEINDRGGIRGQKYDLLVWDTKSSMDGARNGVTTFIRENVAGIIGAPTGEVSFAASKALNDNQLTIISAGSRRRLGDTGPYNFRNTLNDNYAIKQLMQYVVVEKKIKKFALFTSLINDYSIKLSAAFKGEIEKNQAQLTHELYITSPEMANFNQEEVSIPAQLKKLKTNLPDAIIYTGDGNEGAQVLREMRKMGLKIPMIGAEDLMVPEFAALGAAAAGTVVYGGFNEASDNPRIKTFVNNFRKKYNRAPSRVAALSYDAYYMLAAGMEKAKSLRPSHIRNGLLELKDYAGVTGKMSMDKNREAIKEPFIFEVKSKNDKYQFVSVKEPL